MKHRIMTILVASAFIFCSRGNADATTMTASISMDNGYVAYISTNDSVQGTQFASHNNWYTTYTDTTTLDAGTNYFLHVFAYDQGGVAGFLGQFTLSGNDHKFNNGLTTLLTNNIDWKANNTGWASAMTTPTTWGNDGVSPWGNRPGIADNATWIWAGNNTSQDYAYFTSGIYATAAPVPEPSTFILLGAGLAGVGLICRRVKK